MWSEHRSPGSLGLNRSDVLIVCGVGDDGLEDEVLGRAMADVAAVVFFLCTLRVSGGKPIVMARTSHGEMRPNPLIMRESPVIDGIRYRDDKHSQMPHVVKFSGGRSSAALALSLAEAGALDPERGDVVLFANTSAEHPGTWDFAAECCDSLEQEFALPCFWYEFCTVEDAWRGVYRRRQSYRLVTRRPIEVDPNGYRSRGEVFEEMLSYQVMLPNPHSRSC